jgi:segregation and condensation protein B
LEKGFIKITGRKEVPGRPMLYGTTEKFLDYFGLKSLEDLPNISEIKSLVENSIRKEELIQFTGTVVEQTPQDPAGETPAESGPEKITPPDASGLEPDPKSEQN